MIEGRKVTLAPTFTTLYYLLFVSQGSTSSCYIAHQYFVIEKQLWFKLENWLAISLACTKTFTSFSVAFYD